MTRMTIIGIEAMEGVGKTSAKPYAIGRIHTSVPLAAPMTGQLARGAMGTTYDCSPELVKKLANAPLPCVVEVELQDQMKFGKREQIVVDVHPVETIKKAA